MGRCQEVRTRTLSPLSVRVFRIICGSFDTPGYEAPFLHNLDLYGYSGGVIPATTAAVHFHLEEFY